MTIAALSEDTGYHVADPSQDCRGWPVFDESGVRLGQVAELEIDTERERVQALRLDNGASVPVELVALREGTVVVAQPDPVTPLRSAAARERVTDVPEGTVGAPTLEAVLTEKIRLMRRAAAAPQASVVDVALEVNELPRAASAPAPRAPARAFETYEGDFREHHRVFFATLHPYYFYAPAYRFGHDLALDPALWDRPWSVVEWEARRAWDVKNPHTDWDDVKDAVRAGWDKTRAA